MSKRASSIWPGVAEPRDLEHDVMLIGPRVAECGLFQGEAILRTATAYLMAGVPLPEALVIRWTSHLGGVVSVEAHSLSGALVERDFYQQGDGWSCDHISFELPEKYRGGGHARRMLRSSLEGYDTLGVERIAVEAGDQDGGFVWARAGFVPTDPLGVKQVLLRQSAALTPDEFAAVRAVISASRDDDLMRNLATLSVAENPSLGKDLLRGSRWSGYVDLSNPAHRRRLAHSLE